MRDFFESNVHWLEQYDPDLADRLRYHSPDPHVEIFSTPQKFYSLRIQEAGGTRLLHSGQDPVREASRWLESVEITSPYNLLVLGCGLFYHIYQLVNQHQSTLKNLAIIEKDLSVLHAAFHVIDLSPFLRTRSTFFSVESSSSELRTFMNFHITPFTLDGLSIIEHPASCERDPQYYKNVREVVHECLQGGEILLRTKITLGGIIQENILRNAPYLYRLPTVSILHGLFPNIPAFVIGAGPSLDRNIDELRAVGDQGVIIASDTVLKPLRAHGVQPHILVTTDPTALNTRHFDGIDDLGETMLAFAPSVHYRIPNQLTGMKVIFPLQTSQTLRLFDPVRQDTHPLTTGVNVGQTCFNLARYMGCQPIVLAGLDFSFPVEGGATHVSGSALQRKIFATGSPKTMKVELLDEQRSLEEFEPIYLPGNQAEKVATNKFWLAYLRSMEQEIKKTNGRVINCTEGGARVEGAEVRVLKDTIEELCRTDHQVRVNLLTVVGFFFGSPMKEGIGILNECLSILRTAIEAADQGLSELRILEIVYHSENPQKDILLEKVQSLRECHLHLIQDHKVYVVLDEAADLILKPFLQQENRPAGDPASPENIEKTIPRYRAYFDGMKKLCEHYSTVIQETLDSMQNTEIEPFDFQF